MPTKRDKAVPTEVSIIDVIIEVRKWRTEMNVKLDALTRRIERQEKGLEECDLCGKDHPESHRGNIRDIVIGGSHPCRCCGQMTSCADRHVCPERKKK